MFEGNLLKNILLVIFIVKMMSYFLLKCLDNVFLMNEFKDVFFGIWINISYSFDVLYMNINLFCVFLVYIFWGIGFLFEIRDLVIFVLLLFLGFYIWGKGGY